MCRFLVLVINLPMLIINIPNEKRVLLEYTNPARLFSRLPNYFFGVIAKTRTGNPVACSMLGQAANNNAPTGATLSRLFKTSICSFPLLSTAPPPPQVYLPNKDCHCSRNGLNLPIHISPTVTH